MKKIILFSLFLFVVFVGCKKKEPTEPATKDFRENYVGTFNLRISYHSGQHSTIFNDTIYFNDAQISYEINDSIDDNTFPPVVYSTYPAISLLEAGDTASTKIGITEDGVLYGRGVWGGNGKFISTDSFIFINENSYGSQWWHDTIIGRRL